jgi:hypothetical protein
MPITRNNVDLNYKLTLKAGRYVRTAPNKLLTFTGVEQLTPTQWNTTNLHRINKPFVTSLDQVWGKKEPIMSSCFLINSKQTLAAMLRVGNVRYVARVSPKLLGNKRKRIHKTGSTAWNNIFLLCRLKQVLVAAPFVIQHAWSNPLNGFWWNTILWRFTTIVSSPSILVKIGEQYWRIYVKICPPFRAHLEFNPRVTPPDYITLAECF